MAKDRHADDIHAADAAPALPVVRVAVPRPLFRLFDYSLPEACPTPPAGARVRVPFGRERLVGIVTDNAPVDPFDRARPLLDVLDTSPALDGDLLALAHWMADYYHHPLGEVIATILPVSARRGKPLTLPTPARWQRAPDEPAPKRAKKQRELADFLADQGATDEAELIGAGFSRAVIKAAAHRGLIGKAPPAGPAPLNIATGPELTGEQTEAVNRVTGALDAYSCLALDGITGSGKTEVYFRIIEAVLSRGRQVLVLVPEISLTPQTLGRFQRRFGEAAVLHSNLADGERLTTWLECGAGRHRILIGTRSAVLAPFRDLGLIVVDEEHDSSFKQQDGLRYSARDVAVKRAHTLGIPLVLGSATPSLETLHNVATHRYRVARLTRRPGGATLPLPEVIDIRGARLRDGISLPLETAIRAHLDAAGQVLVFLNRRGFATSLICAGCGCQVHCADCEQPMTLHRNPDRLICHHCLRRAATPQACAECGHGLIPLGVGTQRVEAGLAEAFPHTPLLRIDRDTTRTQRQLEHRLREIATGNPAILVGTQMLAKGHHFPNVTLVAVLNADAGFMSPDFRAPERTAQLIVQVAGRAGRAQRPGQVLLQSLQPDNPTLRALLDGGYEAFAACELKTRRAAGMPPFQPIAMIRADSPSAAAAEQHLRVVAEQTPGSIEVLGPAPAPVAQIARKARFQLLLLAPTRRALHSALHSLRAVSPPSNVRVSVDVDPYDTF